MKFTAALIFGATAALALQARQVDEQKLESLSFIDAKCRNDCQVIKDAYHDAKNLQCNAQNPSDECFKAMCGHVQDVVKCAECQLRTGPFADKFSDEQINKAKQDSVDYCKQKGFDA